MLEVRREAGWLSEGDNNTPSKQDDGTVLVGFESFPEYVIFASAFDDQGVQGAVLARHVRTNLNVFIVFPEPDIIT